MSENLNIVLTPVKNESWILETFLSATSLWADLIIILDQNSTDNSVAIAKKFPKVKIIHNEDIYLNEFRRQNMLIESAREHGTNNLLFALDADEIFTSEIQNSEILNNLHSFKEGTAFAFEWINIDPSFQKYWIQRMQPICFKDDGKTIDQNQRLIHRTRVPIENKEVILQREPKVLHFQYLNWENMQLKQEWYQCHEIVYNQDLSQIYLYRKYNHMYKNARSYKQLNRKWIDDYLDKGINLIELKKFEINEWRIIEIDKFILKYGKEFFKEIIFKVYKNRKVKMSKIELYLKATTLLYNNYKIIRYYLKAIDFFVEKFNPLSK